MTPQEAIKILRDHNEWRRYDGPVGEGPKMTDPKDLGNAIDVVCNAYDWLRLQSSSLIEAVERYVQPTKGQPYMSRTELLNMVNKVKEIVK